MKKKLIATFNMMCEALKCALHTYYKEKQRQKSQWEKRVKDEAIFNFMFSMRTDLFEAFHDKHYSHLYTITSVHDIRMEGYNYSKQIGWTYMFLLSKKTSENEKIARTFLSDIRANMNTDISSTQKELQNFWGNQYFLSFYPFLANGVYVMDVKDIGTADLIITVQTHVQPCV